MNDHNCKSWFTTTGYCPDCGMHYTDYIHALREQLTEQKAENERLKKERSQQYQLAQFYRTALQEIRDRTPANEYDEWPHHHWYLCRASNAINHKGLEDKDE